MPRYFMGIAERVHARLCMEEGVVVLGIKGPSGVKNVSVGDKVIYYSPKTEPEGKTLQAFTAIGEVVGDHAYERDFDGGHTLWVRSVDWRKDATEVPIRPLLEKLSFVKNPKNWGFYMRGSKREIPAEDYAVIAGAMLGGAT